MEIQPSSFPESQHGFLCERWAHSLHILCFQIPALKVLFVTSMQSPDKIIAKVNNCLTQDSQYQTELESLNTKRSFRFPGRLPYLNISTVRHSAQMSIQQQSFLLLLCNQKVIKDSGYLTAFSEHLIYNKAKAKVKAGQTNLLSNPTPKAQELLFMFMQSVIDVT